jgi:hypothetical protein
MGIFNFKKKKDPLDDLGLPSGEDTSFDGLPNTGQSNDDFSQPNFQHQSPESSDSMSGHQSYSPPLEQNNFDSQNQNNSANADPYAQYQAAVSSSPESFHTSNQQTPNASQQPSGSSESHSTELILSKLDVLKAMIENLGHRIENLEQKYQYDKEQRKKSW